MSFLKLNFSIILAPILAIFFSMVANGFLTTFITVRLHEMGEREWTIGLISTAYYIGIAVGAFNCEKFTLRVGHIRAYSTFAALSVVSALLCGLVPNVIAWFFFRLITGISIAGIWVVIESWFLNISSSENRGKYLALYMFSLYGANSLGQLLLNFADSDFLQDFAIIAALTAFSIIPLAMTSMSAPQIEEPDAVSIQKLIKINPSGIMACFVAGIVLAVLYSILPYYFELLEVSKNRIALIMFITILGGTFLQFPIGYISDIIDRRKVLLYVSACLVVISIVVIQVPETSLIFLPLMFVFGGITFALNPVGMSHVCDFIKNENIVSVTQGLVFVYGIGNIIGPFVSPAFISVFGPNGIFIFFALMGGGLFLFLLYRIRNFDRVPDKYRQQFVVTSRTTPVAAGLDPRSEEVDEETHVRDQK